MYELTLVKPDGRNLALYSRAPIVAAAVPGITAAHSDSHLRWHPLRGEWVIYAGHRQGRTFLPPPPFDPLAPSDDPGVPTELPLGQYDVAVFDNLFPALHPQPLGNGGLPSADGHCEVVVFTQDPKTSLGALPISHIELLLQVWARRTATLAQDPSVRYVLPFENRGIEVGVTLHHPHGQIYAYPFVPPVPERMHSFERAHYDRHGETLLQSIIRAEIDAGVRLIYAGEHAIAFVPSFARYPYEVWVAPRAGTPEFSALTAPQRLDLARALKTVLLKYDGLWARPFPYVMAWYQAPLEGSPRVAFHLHAQFYPAYRMRDRLKFLAGTEIAAGTFVNDTMPEEKAIELQSVAVVCE